MTYGPALSASPAAAACLTGFRAWLMLAVSPPRRSRHSIDVHAVLNLLNRLTATEDTGLREELVDRLAGYLAAVHRIEAGPALTLAGLCELTRGYAAMRYLMADAIEPRIDHGETDFSLRTEQWTEMTAFLQAGVDSLLNDYTARVSLSVRRLAWWQVEVTMLAKASPGHVRSSPHDWQPLPDGSGHIRSARFTAIVRPLTPS
ncbi:hypothetical protein GN316_17940 [Xylophilus sp. Kf1]|nr:hypothetical protein [Xylophilus sp. Kf1]